VRGKAGIQEYTDQAVNDAAVKRVRELATAVGDPAITEDQAQLEVDLANGEKLTRFVEKSLGNVHRPLTDKQLEDKFRNQAVLALPAAQVEKLIEQAWRIDDLADVNELIQAALPAAIR
jgi:2-methylcitrate dehydratase PrpD